ncbi:MAG: hypothetical protein AB7F86_13325 [Bdellovibrionales bacterium]
MTLRSWISLFVFVMLAFIMFGPEAPAKTLSRKKNSTPLQTDVRFDGSTLHGQYQVPDEATAKVEDEKGLSELLKVRKDFKDRLKEAADQE